MTTKSQKGMTWSLAAADRARAANKYIKVGGNGGYLTVSGAEKMFQKYPDFIYLPAQRIAGNLNDVKQVLAKYQFDLNTLLPNAITAQNYKTTMAKVFQNELNDYDRGRTQTGTRAAKNAKPARYGLRDLEWMVNGLSQVQFIPKPVASKSGKSPQPGQGQVRKTGTRGTRKTLAERLADAESKGKVLDVSNMDQIRLVALPSGQKSKKVHVPGLAIIANRDSFKNYEAAVRQLPADKHHFIEQFRQKIMGPVTSPRTSPTRTHSPRMQQLSPLQPAH